ncbi:hypothetical protein [Sulfitobacter aestuariivivens]|uniref:hypothetical protein n=1 Tax=Sulfitobacter aestuariivivens TaxID=2766981 RepID=UPI003613E023
MSPLTLLIICWGGTGLVALVALLSLDHLPLVQTYMLREQLSVSVFGWAGFSWLFVAVLAYGLGDLAARAAQRRPPRMRLAFDLSKLARVTFIANLILLGVTGIWIMLTATKTGGIWHLAAAAYEDSLSTRDLLLETKLFTGMRLFYAALPATAGLAAGLLAAGQLTQRARFLMWIVLAVNTAALFVLPMVMSQRLLLLQLMLSAYITACVVRGRIIGVIWLAGALVLFGTLWVAREAVTNPLMQTTATQIASQKLLFYVVNDMWNAFAPLSTHTPIRTARFRWRG